MAFGGRERGPRILRGSAVVSLSLGYFAYVFHLFRGTLLRSGLDGWLDPYFLNYLLEHWYHSLWHAADPASPSIYFPATGALGYSCGLILYAPFYLLVRPFLHPFPAYTVTLLAVMETGALCLYVILRRFMGLRFLESLVLTAFFISSTNVINSWHTNVWSQTASIFLVPPILLLTLIAAQRAPGRSRLALAGASGLLWTLLFSQDFYTGWFVLLVSTLLLLGALAVAPTRALLRRGIEIWRTERPAILAFAGGAAAGALVFLWIYGAAYRERHGFPEQQLMSALVARAAPDWSHPVTAMRSLVVYVGARSFQFVFLIGLLAWVPWFRVPLRVRLYTCWFLVVSAIVLVGGIKFTQYLGWRNYSAWKQLFRWFPGYDAIRDPKRIIYTYELAVALLTGLFLARLPPRSVLRTGAAVLAFGLLMFEPNHEVFRFARPVAVFDRWVEAPIAIDPSCRSFFVKEASPEYESRSGHAWSLYGVDAAFIALNVSIPTLNGYTAWSPPGWSLSTPSNPFYLAAVRQWIEQHQLTNVCQLDLDARTMTPFDPALADR